MEIRTINNQAGTALDKVQNISPRRERERESEKAERIRGPQDGGILRQAVEQSLSQLGLSASRSANLAPRATASQENDAAAAAANTGNNPNQAVQAFMYSLVQALRPQASSASDEATPAAAPAQAAASRYDDLAGRLQNLVQAMGNTNEASAAAAKPSTDNPLQTAFQNLAQALQGRTSPQANPETAPDLQSFLKTLAQNLSSKGTQLDSSGNLVNTQA